MLKDIPYDTLKQNSRDYEILTLHDHCNSPFSEIALKFELSRLRAVQIYRKMKLRQIYLYANHLSVVSGHADATQFQKLSISVLDCYRDYAHVSAYLEKEYKGLLEEYRAGEPGMPQEFIDSMPPYKPEPDTDTARRVVEMREADGKPYQEIGRELRITHYKARHTYEMYYHEKMLNYVRALQERTEDKNEKDSLWDRYFRGLPSSKKQHDLILREHPELQGPEDTPGQLGPK